MLARKCNASKSEKRRLHRQLREEQAATLNANQQIAQANQQAAQANNAAQQAANAAQLATQAANAANNAATLANQARDAANVAKARVEQDRNNAVACIEMASEQRNMLQTETSMVDAFLDRCGTSWEAVAEQLTLEKVVAKNMELHKKTWEQRKRAQEKKDGKNKREKGEQDKEQGPPKRFLGDRGGMQRGKVLIFVEW